MLLAVCRRWCAMAIKFRAGFTLRNTRQAMTTEVKAAPQRRWQAIAAGWRQSVALAAGEAKKPAGMSVPLSSQKLGLAAGSQRTERPRHRIKQATKRVACRAGAGAAGHRLQPLQAPLTLPLALPDRRCPAVAGVQVGLMPFPASSTACASI